MKVWAGLGLACLSLTACVPGAALNADQFSAITSVVDGRVQMAVTNRGPSAVWLDRNVCPSPFTVKIGGTFTLRPWPDGVRETCTLMYKQPTVWKMGETKMTTWPNAHLASGQATLIGTAQLKIAPVMQRKLPVSFTTVQVAAPPTNVNIP